ncbi:hypothetical protein [uncultured Erythrobacter sp.]|uniref:hypothetical protein n=1 Tax=uncultured Erythrobacter sp. TaxID=263913 RepID=UPI00261396C8|nr:hypothetical protein [uncultured Erythrobacter sp.]
MALKVLIIEDDVLIARDISYTVEDAGHIVAGIARSTDQAKEMIADARPDCATLNFTLLDGPSTAIAQHLHDLHIPFVLLSNDGERAKQLLPMAPWRVIEKVRQSIELDEALNDLSAELSDD